MADFADFKARYPSLVTANDGNQIIIQSFLDEALLFVNVSLCPKFADLLQMSYAAHALEKSEHAIDGMNDSPGQLQSESVDGVSYSYQVKDAKSVSEEWYLSTPYGKDFLRIKRMCRGVSFRTT